MTLTLRRMKDTLTRLKNLELEAKAIAAQPDASAIERAQPELLARARAEYETMVAECLRTHRAEDTP